jgi:hypothetical protein
MHTPHSGSVTLLRLFLISQPSLRAENIDIVTENAYIACNNTGVDANFCTSGDKATIWKLESFFGNFTLEDQTNSRRDSHRLAHDGVKVWQLADLLPLGNR